ncbi:MAG TPA: glycosyltransferase [Opitutaceae bacterium]
MRICFFTNTFLPHVGGVARSVETFLKCYRRKRHKVLVVAPEFAEGSAPAGIERMVLRVPSIQNFNGSNFSVRLPLATSLTDRLDKFPADIIHTHHPFLLGDTALRIAASRNLPVVFTHHTLYEQYTHYMPFDSERVQEFVIELATRFANRCHGVIAPSESIARLIASRGVTVPIRVVPTGIDSKKIAGGNRQRLRGKLGIPDDAVVIGHVGRLAEEKNLDFLGKAVASALKRLKNARLLVVGTGPAQTSMEKLMDERGVADRAHFTGTLTGTQLIDAYAAMDLFAFTSHSETQGLVVTEAMAAGLPVIALDASGVREVVEDRTNGRLLASDASVESMARILASTVLNEDLRGSWSAAARKTAARFDQDVTADRALEFYRAIVAAHRKADGPAAVDSSWDSFVDRITIEAQLITDKIGAISHALTGSAVQAGRSS